MLYTCTDRTDIYAYSILFGYLNILKIQTLIQACTFIRYTRVVVREISVVQIDNILRKK